MPQLLHHSPRVATTRTTLIGFAMFGVLFGVVDSVRGQARATVEVPRQTTTTAATRLIPLYYARDVAEVIALIRGQTPLNATTQPDQSSGELELLMAERRRLQDMRAAHLSTQQSSVNPNLPAAFGLQTTAPPDDSNLHQFDQAIQRLETQEQALRAQAFRGGGNTPRSFSSQGAQRNLASSDIADHVSVGVVGEAKLHLRGPLEGVNAIAKMVHEIDQPVGQVKIGIHVLQLSSSDDEAIEDMHSVIDRHLHHARFMSRESQQLFRAAISMVASRVHAHHPDRFAEAFFYAPCLRNFRAMHGGGNGPLSIEALDSRDVVNSLFLACVANHEVRQEILAEFQRLVATELPRHHERYLAANNRNQTSKPASSRFRIPGFSASDPSTPALITAREPDFSFSRITSFLHSVTGHQSTANSIQVALIRYQRAFLALRDTDAAVAKMRNQRLLLQALPNRETPQTVIHPLSGQTMDRSTFEQLVDRTISEREKHATDIREVLRAEVATLDGQLRKLSEAFDEDVRKQFYQPALEELRRSSRSWKVHMGQIQTTTIVTNDRTRARVSPEQVAVLEQPKRQILLQEGLQVAHGVAQEARAVSQAAAAYGVSEALVPGSSALLSAAGVAPVPGKHLEDLTTKSNRKTVSVGDDIVVTPVIQPDGASVAFHLLYTHTPRVSASDNESPAPGGVRRHFIEAEVQAQSHEIKEVSRFRVELDADQQGNGVALLEDLPLVGGLFRPRRSAGSTIQENIILTDVVVYPTVQSQGDGWLAFESKGANGSADSHQASAPYRGQIELAEWVEQTLQHHAQTTLTGRARPLLALPPVDANDRSVTETYRR